MEKNAQVNELQNREATLRDELSSKVGLLEFYQEQNQQLEKELGEALSTLATTKNTLSSELTSTVETLDRCRHELQHHKAGLESESSTNGDLRAQLRELSAEREEAMGELRSSIGRIESIESAHAIKDDVIAARDTVRSTLARRCCLTLHTCTRVFATIWQHASLTVSQNISRCCHVQEISTLSLRLNEKDERLMSLEAEVCALRVEADDAALLRASTNHLADQMAARGCAVRDFSGMHNAVARDAAVHFETTAACAAMDQSRFRLDAEARTRAIEAELAASRANAEMSCSRSTRMMSRPMRVPRSRYVLTSTPISRGFQKYPLIVVVPKCVLVQATNISNVLFG
jgi:hypothetical protein